MPRADEKAQRSAKCILRAVLVPNKKQISRKIPKNQHFKVIGIGIAGRVGHRFVQEVDGLLCVSFAKLNLRKDDASVDFSRLPGGISICCRQARAPEKSFSRQRT